MSWAFSYRISFLWTIAFLLQSPSISATTSNPTNTQFAQPMATPSWNIFGTKWPLTSMSHSNLWTKLSDKSSQLWQQTAPSHLWAGFGALATAIAGATYLYRYGLPNWWSKKAPKNITPAEPSIKPLQPTAGQEAESTTPQLRPAIQPQQKELASPEPDYTKIRTDLMQKKNELFTALKTNRTAILDELDLIADNPNLEPYNEIPSDLARQEIGQYTRQYKNIQNLTDQLYKDIIHALDGVAKIQAKEKFPPLTITHNEKVITVPAALYDPIVYGLDPMTLYDQALDYIVDQNMRIDSDQEKIAFPQMVAVLAGKGYNWGTTHNSLQEALKEFKPPQSFYTYSPNAWDNPIETIENNIKKARTDLLEYYAQMPAAAPRKKVSFAPEEKS